MDGVSFKSFRCSCGKELMDMKQMGKLAEKFRKMKSVRFAKWGNSIAVRIPKDIAEELNIKDGTEGFLMKDGKSLKIINS